MARLVLGLLSQVRINQSQHHDQKKIKSNSYFLAHDATLISNIRLMVEIPESGPPLPLQHLPRHLRDHHGLQQLFPGIHITFLADHQLMLSLLILKFLSLMAFNDYFWVAPWLFFRMFIEDFHGWSWYLSMQNMNILIISNPLSLRRQQYLVTTVRTWLPWTNWPTPQLHQVVSANSDFQDRLLGGTGKVIRHWN